MSEIRKIFIVFYGSILLVSAKAQSTPAEYVNPLIGTAIDGDGAMAPFIGVPFGMTNFLPQTQENRIGKMPYVYDDNHIIGWRKIWVKWMIMIN
jgi:putative alpha-1,2-mannosidase